MFKIPFRTTPALPLYAIDEKSCFNSIRGVIEEGVKTIYPGHGGAMASRKGKKNTEIDTAMGSRLLRYISPEEALIFTRVYACRSCAWTG